MTTAHDTRDKRNIAWNGLIYHARVGSAAYGIARAGVSDQDEIGICLEPPEYVTGLKTFEQWNHHSAGSNEDGTTRKSGQGDLDITVYSARKFLRLYLNGNPSIIEVLHVQDSDVIMSVPFGNTLRENRHRLRSPDAGKRYLGYLKSQREALEGKRGSRVHRPDLVAEHGYDTKFAAHAIRLGYMGIEYVTTGQVTLPMEEHIATELRAVRNGERTFDEAMSALYTYEDALLSIVKNTEIPKPDYKWANDWLHWAHVEYWDSM